jgi:hypothetical protein
MPIGPRKCPRRGRQPLSPYTFNNVGGALRRNYAGQLKTGGTVQFLKLCLCPFASTASEDEHLKVEKLGEIRNVTRQDKPQFLGGHWIEDLSNGNVLVDGVAEVVPPPDWPKPDTTWGRSRLGSERF